MHQHKAYLSTSRSNRCPKWYELIFGELVVFEGKTADPKLRGYVRRVWSCWSAHWPGCWGRLLAGLLSGGQVSYERHTRTRKQSLILVGLHLLSPMLGVEPEPPGHFLDYHPAREALFWLMRPAQGSRLKLTGSDMGC